MKPKTEQNLLAVWMPATAVFAAILTFATLIVYDNMSMGASRYERVSPMIGKQRQSAMDTTRYGT